MKKYINLYDVEGRSLGATELFPRIVPELPDKGVRDADLVFNQKDKKTYLWYETKWVEVLALEPGKTLDLAYIPVLDWTKLLFPGVRQEVLKEFSDPKILMMTSSMLDLMGSAEKVEVVAGNVSATSKELTIIGGSSTATGFSWIFWDLPGTFLKVYAKTFFCSVDTHITAISFCDASASTLINPPDVYITFLDIPAVKQDFKFYKSVGGVGQTLSIESVSLAYLTFYSVEMFYVGDGTGANRIRVWRDGVLKFDFSETEPEIPNIQAVRFYVYDGSTTAALSGKYRGYTVIIYE